MGDRSPAVIAVLDYGIGNLRSAEKALEYVGAKAVLSADPEVVSAADAVVLPGVGSFGPCREALGASGLDVVALDAIASGRPFLGICVGMQLLYDGSEESPDVVGLGVLPGIVRRLPSGIKHPQMQWNQLELLTESPLFDGLGDRPWMYFVHSFSSTVTPQTIATVEYGNTIAAACQRENVYATQFHPEKSGKGGLALLSNFVRIAERHAEAARDSGRTTTPSVIESSGA